MKKLEVLKFRDFSCSIYLIRGEEGHILIDSGSFHVRDELIGRLNSMGIGLDDCVVLNTHCHFDHIGNNDLFKCFVSIETKSALNELGGDVVWGGRENGGICDFDVEGTFADNEKIKIRGEEFLFIHTPGHTKDSYCIYWADEKILFSGDTLFANGIVGRTDLLSSSHPDLMESLLKLKRLELDVLAFYAGHGNCSYDYKRDLDLALENDFYGKED